MRPKGDQSNLFNRVLQVGVGLFVLFIGCIGYPQSTNLPLNHWAYEFLNRLEVRGFFKSYHLRMLPISRQLLAEIIIQIDRPDSANKIQLSQAERDLLEQLKGEFHEELDAMNFESQPRYQERHLLTWRENDSKIKLDLDFSQRFDVYRGTNRDSTARTSLTTLGGIVRGSLKKSLGFYLHFKNTLVRGKKITAENFNPELGFPITISGDNVYQDEASAYFIWKSQWFQMEFGRDQVQWGPGYQGSLMVSAQNPLFDILKIQVQFKKFQFTSFHGKLTSRVGRKYLAAHRVEVQFLPWLFLAGSESVIYGNRSAELQYLNPIMPYHIAEHHLGDRDNNTMGLDVTLFPKMGHKLYGELFIDDFTLAENPFRYYGNKFAFLVGHHWANPVRLKNVDLKTEYARIEPYVYTHEDPINVYENYNRIIGHWLGPNSDQLYLEASYLVNRDLKMNLIAERVRHGEGDIHTPYSEEKGRRKFFLSGIVETRWRFGYSITDQIFKDCFLNLQYHHIRAQNLNRVSGENSTDNQIVLQLNVNW